MASTGQVGAREGTLKSPCRFTVTVVTVQVKARTNHAGPHRPKTCFCRGKQQSGSRGRAKPKSRGEARTPGPSPSPAHWTEACVTCRAAGEDAPPRRGDLAEMLWAESHANLGGGLHWTAVSRKQVLGADDEWEKPLGWADMQLRCLSAQDH